MVRKDLRIGTDEGRLITFSIFDEDALIQQMKNYVNRGFNFLFLVRNSEF
jgi:hypothetical protein